MEEGNTTHGENSHEHEKGSLSSWYLKLINRVHLQFLASTIFKHFFDYMTKIFMLNCRPLLGLARLSDGAKVYLLAKKAHLI